MNRINRKFLLFFTLLFAALTITASFGHSVTAQAAEEKTGVDLADHVLLAYKNGWKYRSGCYGQFVGNKRASDCSGLIKSYLWWQGEGQNPNPGSMSVAGSSGAMLQSAEVSGDINYNDPSSLPRIHGLILYQPGHVGVYVGNNMAIDNRSSGEDMKYEEVFGRRNIKWTKWFKLPRITYPTTGWATYDGDKYYYENGQYVINTIRIIDGISYTFGEDGKIVEQKPYVAS